MNDSNLQSPFVRFGIALSAIAFIIAAPVSGYFLTRMFIDARVSASWPSVMGTLIRADTKTSPGGKYSADVRYNYRVDGRDFVGSKVRLSDGNYKQRESVERMIRDLAPGQPVPVFYNPADPSIAVLQTGAGFQEYALLFVPVLMLGVGVWRGWVLWTSRSGHTARV